MMLTLEEKLPDNYMLYPYAHLQSIVSSLYQKLLQLICKRLLNIFTLAFEQINLEFGHIQYELAVLNCFSPILKVLEELSLFGFARLY